MGRREEILTFVRNVDRNLAAGLTERQVNLILCQASCVAMKIFHLCMLPSQLKNYFSLDIFFLLMI